MPNITFTISVTVTRASGEVERHERPLTFAVIDGVPETSADEAVKVFWASLFVDDWVGEMETIQAIAVVGVLRSFTGKNAAN